MNSRDVASPEEAAFVFEDDHPAPSLARAFDPFRTVKEPTALVWIEEVIGQIQGYEAAHGLRQRARKARDLENFRRTVSAILVDLMNADALGHAHGLHLSRRKAELTGRCRYRPRFIGEGLPAILDAMAALGLIVQEKGAWGAARTQTIIRASEALEGRFRMLRLELDAFGEAIDRETIELRDRKSRSNAPADRLGYQDTAEMAGWRSNMLAINRHLADARLDIDLAFLKNPDQPVDTSRRVLRRVFHNSSFNQGGRLYGGFWQKLSKQDRFEALNISGEPIVELDFRQIGLRIAYAHVGAVAPLGDLYAIPGYERHRKGVKAVISSMLYAGVPLKRLPQNTKMLLPPRTSIQRMVADVKAAHPAVSKLFATGFGLCGQRVESDLLVSILLDLERQGIVALPIHDAVLVPASKASATKDVMERQATLALGFPVEVEVCAAL